MVSQTLSKRFTDGFQTFPNLSVFPMPSWMTDEEVSSLINPKQQRKHNRTSGGRNSNSTFVPQAFWSLWFANVQVLDSVYSPIPICVWPFSCQYFFAVNKLQLHVSYAVYGSWRKILFQSCFSKNVLWVFFLVHVYIFKADCYQLLDTDL